MVYNIKTSNIGFIDDITEPKQVEMIFLQKRPHCYCVVLVPSSGHTCKLQPKGRNYTSHKTYGV